MSADLVVIDLPGGPGFVGALRQVWDRGDAAFPLDRRLPGPARQALLAAMAPGAVIDERGESALPGGRPVEPGDALVVATSGSTGEPKGAVLTHEAVTASARATNARLALTADDHWLACLPLAHIGGLSVVTRALVAGTALTVIDGFDAATVDRSEATLVSLVATALARIDATRFRTIVLGGAAPPPVLPPNVVTTYGMTETGSGIVYDGVPLDGVEIRLDGDGQIDVRAPMLLRAYRDGTAPLRDGWFATGDLGGWLPDGRLAVDGRAADVIVTGGEKVWPAAVEAVLREHASVADVAVVGRPDPEWGHAVTAYVVAATATAPPTLAELRSFVKDRLAPYCAPCALEFVTQIPRTALGKPRRAELARASAPD
ncbi:MAG: AMP-binding protein [Actinomycetota bacterium]|nr:AMP-binding protein [Actinomycetota bacterium]